MEFIATNQIAGQVKLEEISEGGTASMVREGWSLVGITTLTVRPDRYSNREAGPAPYGVFVRTENVALKEAIERAEKAEKETSEKQSKLWCTERELKELKEKHDALKLRLIDATAEQPTE